MKQLVLSLAFVGMGTFAMAQQRTMPAKDDQQRKEMMEQKKAEHLAEMQKELNLSQVQVAQLKALHEKHQAQREAQRKENQELRKQKMETFKKDKQQMDNEMRQILTPEQYAKWEAKKAEKMANRKAKFQDKRMNKGLDKNKMHTKPVQK